MTDREAAARGLEPIAAKMGMTGAELVTSLERESAGQAEAQSDPVAAYLAEVRERADAVVRNRDVRYEGIIAKMESAAHVPRLLGELTEASGG